MSIRMSDHAKVRYLERVVGIHLTEMFEQEVLKPELMERIKRRGDGIYWTEKGDGRLVVRDGEIVTVLPPRWKPRPPRDRVMTARS